MKLTKIQQKFMRWVEEADKYGEVAYFEFGMLKPFYRRTCSSEVTPHWAVCYAYASEHNLLSLLFSSRTKDLDLSEVFPLVCGKYSVSCGDYVADKRNN